MKLKEYMELHEPGAEVTCWDKDVDSEFYFYNKETGKNSLFGDDFPNVNKCDELLRELLDVVKVHDGGVEVNLYALLEKPEVIEFAKKNMFDERQYEEDIEVVMMLFDDNVKNFANGYEGFSELMVECLISAYKPEQSKDNEREKAVFNTTDSELTQYNGTVVEVIRPLTQDECDIDDVGKMYKVKFHDGYIRDAFQDELSDVPSQAKTKYVLGFGHLGNGVVVWNRLQEEHGDYKKVAYISANREVKYYDNNLPLDIKQKIENFAATSTLTISATQDQQVFHVPPKKPSLDDRIRSSEASSTNNNSLNKTEKDIGRE